MISTSRLRIQRWTLEMVQDFYELTLDDGFNLFPITNYKQKNIQTARDWIAINTAKMAVYEQERNSLVGMGGLTPWKFEDENLVDITYRLRKKSWGQGYGFELANALVEYGVKELGLTQITATITSDNIASKKIALKLGMKFDRPITLLGISTDLYRLYL